MSVTPEEFDELKESFQYNDSNEDGKIEFDEFVSMLEELEADVEEDEARVGFRTIDTDKDGAIELDEFVAWWSDR
ncbi:MAG TPA: EF-hand domain-containing protein [Gammaproteobacteria bacterium]|jgi:Ca2+-binding EF-hand superfamily protein